MNIQEELNNIAIYLKQKYGLDTWKDKLLDDNAIYFKNKEWTYDIEIWEPSEDTFAPNDYILSFNGNKKNEGFGIPEIYKKGDYKSFEKWFKKYEIEPLKEQQISLF